MKIDLNSRPPRDETGLLSALVWSMRSTCPRRKTGCVLVDKNFHVLSTGYNGVASQMPHCIDNPCPGAGLPSGTGLDLCEAIHAEANALIQCKLPQEIHTCYTIASPCINCVKLLMNTSCKRIVFAVEYPHPQSVNLWLADNERWWIHHPLDIE